MLICNLQRQGYREIKLHVILVGVMETIYKDHDRDKPQADLNLDYIRLYKIIKELTHKLIEHSVKHASAPIKTRFAL